MNKVFSRRTKARKNTLKTLAKAITANTTLKELSLEGNKLKLDIIDVLLALLNNNYLETINIVDNQGGDRMAERLAKVFQHNNSLKTVYWDGNEISLSGLKIIRLGLQRNKSITYMPLPLMDISNILKNTNIDQQQVTDEISEIQNTIFKISNHVRIVGHESELAIPTIHLTLTNTNRRQAPPSTSKSKKRTTIDMAKASRLFGNELEDVSGEVSAEVPGNTADNSTPIGVTTPVPNADHSKSEEEGDNTTTTNNNYGSNTIGNSGNNTSGNGENNIIGPPTSITINSVASNSLSPGLSSARSVKKKKQATASSKKSTKTKILSSNSMNPSLTSSNPALQEEDTDDATESTTS